MGVVFGCVWVGWRDDVLLQGEGDDGVGEYWSRSGSGGTV